MKKVFFILAIASLFVFSGCTKNQRAKQWGGEATYDLPKGKKLIVVTWKDDNMWYLMRDARSGEKSETYQFVEESSFGLMEGTIILKEHIGRK